MTSLVPEGQHYEAERVKKFVMLMYGGKSKSKMQVLEWVFLAI